VIFDSLSAQDDGLSFTCDDGDRLLPCGITDNALRELIYFHRIKSNERTALQILLSEIERLVNAKSDAGRFEENGCIIVWPVDLLRYGYQSREPLAA
jgi:hypothetical protein